MTYGPHAAWLIKAALERGDPVPDDAAPPSIPDDYFYVYGAFADLNADRDTGFARGTIRFTAIDAYARRAGIVDADEFEEFVTDIRLLDRLFLAAADKKPDET